MSRTILMGRGVWNGQKAVIYFNLWLLGIAFHFLLCFHPIEFQMSINPQACILNMNMRGYDLKLMGKRFGTLADWCFTALNTYFLKVLFKINECWKQLHFNMILQVISTLLFDILSRFQWLKTRRIQLKKDY